MSILSHLCYETGSSYRVHNLHNGMMNISNPTSALPIAPLATLACEDIASQPHFRRLSSIVGIVVELRYQSLNNFVGRDLYSPLDCGWLHRHAASALEASIGWLRTKRPDLSMLVLDALRPQRVQEQIGRAHV